MGSGLPEPIGTVLEVVYDLVLELAEGTNNPKMFQHRFFGELTRVELAMLKQKGDMSLPTFPHPLPAMKTYRSFMCGASIYEGLGAAKLRLRDHDTMEIQYWHCPYAGVCSSRSDKICVRTHSLTEAADLMSPSSFNEIEDLMFSDEGNCDVFVRINFTGDLRDIAVEDKVIDERPSMHLTREEAETFLLRSLLAGTEYACSHLPEVNVRHTLRQLAKGIDEAGVDEEHLKEFPMLRRGLKRWRQGRSAFTRND